MTALSDIQSSICAYKHKHGFTDTVKIVVSKFLLKFYNQKRRPTLLKHLQNFPKFYNTVYLIYIHN